jgi:hypothetical protein
MARFIPLKNPLTEAMPARNISVCVFYSIDFNREMSAAIHLPDASDTLQFRRGGKVGNL